MGFKWPHMNVFQKFLSKKGSIESWIVQFKKKKSGWRGAWPWYIRAYRITRGGSLFHKFQDTVQNKSVQLSINRICLFTQLYYTSPPFILRFIKYKINLQKKSLTWCSFTMPSYGLSKLPLLNIYSGYALIISTF